MARLPAVYAISVLAALHPASRSATSDHPPLPTGLDCKGPKPDVEVETQDDDMEKGYADSGVVVSAGPSRRGTGTTVAGEDGEIVVMEEDVVAAVQREELQLPRPRELAQRAGYKPDLHLTVHRVGRRWRRIRHFL